MISKVLVIGSGPIVIGQGAEFDYSGTQACRALKDEGIEIVLMNSNPATIMTDETVADKVYSEPLNLVFAKKVIEQEHPDGILVSVGGQTALNLGIELDSDGILDRLGIKVLGTSIENIKRGEDREAFKVFMESINEPIIESHTAVTYEEAKEMAEDIGYPVVVRPAYTLGGSGGGIADDEETLHSIVQKGLQYSAVNQVLIERSIKGWKEIEYEMVRDCQGHAITICNMENIDPVGIHTGDSIVVAPSQTLSDKEYQMLRSASIKIVNALEIVGGCNVQLALDPLSHNYFVIEVNPRVSRSSSLASKATGYPIAKVATKLALGYALDEIENEITHKTKACFEPALDYCVIKIPKWPFDKFDYADNRLGTAMKATGEAMAIGNNLEMALLKAIRSLEIDQYNLCYLPAKSMVLDDLMKKVSDGDPERIFYIAELMRREVGLQVIQQLTGIDYFFLDKIERIVKLEKSISNRMIEFVDPEEIRKLKKRGFSDCGMAQLMLKTTEEDIYAFRQIHGINPVYKMVDTCAAEFDAESPYYYSTYDEVTEVVVSDKRKILVVGSGPIRIGQGVEFDYCSVHGIVALKKEGIEAIMINNNPETVSTDFDVSDKLYFEPITLEDVTHVIECEGIEGVILQFGGQTAIKLAKALSQRGIKIFGTSYKDMNATEDRDIFDQMLEREGIKRPKGKGIYNAQQGLHVAERLGYPLIVRPSYVIGGFGMEIVHTEQDLMKYLESAYRINPEQSVLVDQFVQGIEVDVDVLSDGKNIFIPGIMEHIEHSGVHSGDSIAIYPPLNVDKDCQKEILKISKNIAQAFNLIGIFNIQFIIKNQEIYVIEVNARASRTVPIMSKVTGVRMIEVATRLMLGEAFDSMGLVGELGITPSFYAVKNPVFSMEKISEAEIALSPEMKSTGETMSIEENPERAIFKGFIASGQIVPRIGRALVSISEPFKDEAMPIVHELMELGYVVEMTEGSWEEYDRGELETSFVEMDIIKKKIVTKAYDLIFNIPTRGKDKATDGFMIRRMAVEHRVPCFTSVDTMKWMIKLIKSGLSQSDCQIYDICSINNTDLHLVSRK
jgi:carbamoyl-phosphate synthase large subunit